MSESIAARVDDDTAEWLEQVANQEDTTISQLVAAILQQHTRDIDDDEPDSTEVRLNEIEERIVRIEQDIQMLSEHAEDVEYQVYKTADLARSIELTSGELPFRKLPTNDEANVYPEEKPSVESLDELI